MVVKAGGPHNSYCCFPNGAHGTVWRVTLRHLIKNPLTPMKKKLSVFWKKIYDYRFWILAPRVQNHWNFFDIFVLYRDMTFLFSFFQHCTSFLFFPVRTLDLPPPPQAQNFTVYYTFSIPNKFFALKIM